ncbi:MAG: helix-turn-helix domain-containing protein, partial [Tepidisphaeraceae bacterium]
ALLVRELARATGHATAAKSLPRRSPPLPEPAVANELRQVLRYVDDQLHAIAGVDDLVEFSGRSRSTLERLFKRHMVCTPLEHLAAVRMRRAKQMLASTRLSVADIGRAVGIDDASYFSKSFRAHVGTPPLKYRQTSTSL